MAESTTVVISSTGDLILDVRHEEEGECFNYQVESSRIRRSSPFFEHLLGGPFSEAAEVREKHKALQAQYGSFDKVPLEQLPHISVVDIGQISTLTTIKNITADFLRLLHGLDLSTPLPPVANIANLAIVADRFDSLEILSAHVKRKNLLRTLDTKARVKTTTEERARQKLLVGYLLDYGPWVTRNSKHLILSGSKQWESALEAEAEVALWWDLPHGIEEELRYRRERVLETLSSIPTYFVKVYMAGERQCKLGYDSSVACDSFQLGEMIKFLSRTNVVRIQSLLLDSVNATQYNGDIDRLVDSLRKCPNYQIDSNHAHCGLRTRMIPVLDWLQFWLDRDSGSPDVALCVECFKNRREEYAWSDTKRPLIWRRSGTLSQAGRPRQPATSGQCSHRQFGVREMFMATDRDWS